MADTGKALDLNQICVPCDAGITRTVRIQYRHATLDGAPQQSMTLQERLGRAMKTDIAKDVSKRLFKVTQADDGPQGCLNLHQSTTLAFIADIMHFDGRQVSLRFIHSATPTPVAKIEPHQVGANESSLSEPIYFMARGNHLAVIERPSFSLPQFARYINALLATAGQLEADTQWKLAPKIQYTNVSAIGGAVKRVIFRPRAAIDGYGATHAPEPKRRRRDTQAIIEEVLASGSKLVDILKAAGASEAKIESLRQNMSCDLAIRAKIELSFFPVKRKTTAEVSPEIVHYALTELADDGDVDIIADDGKTQGKLVSLSHRAEVLEVDGLLEWTRATEALASALGAWYAKGAIDIHDEGA